MNGVKNMKVKIDGAKILDEDSKEAGNIIELSYRRLIFWCELCHNEITDTSCNVGMMGQFTSRAIDGPTIILNHFKGHVKGQEGALPIEFQEDVVLERIVVAANKLSLKTLLQLNKRISDIISKKAE